MQILRALALVLLLACHASTGTALAATFTVLNTSDSGAGSLRQAILDANASVGTADNIEFDAAIASGSTITLLTPLPGPSDVGGTVAINGDRDTDCDPDINVKGDATFSGQFVLQLNAGSSVRGLAFHTFPNATVSYLGNGATVLCSYFGTDTGGVAALPAGSANSGTVVLQGGRSNNVFGPGNLVANGRGAGLRIQDGNTNAYPNFTALSSDAAPRVYPIVQFGEVCGSFTNGGFTPVDGGGKPFTENFGARLRGTLTIGTTGDYTFDFTPADDAVTLRLDALTIGEVTAATPQPQQIVANGLTAGPHLIEIDFRENQGASSLTLAISGPGSAALATDGQALCATGQAGLCAELFQLRVAGEHNKITQSRFRDNGGRGIEFGTCGPYANDPGDADVGPNTLLNTPVITSVTRSGSDYNIVGTAPAGATVELFQAAEDVSGYGEGATFLASQAASGGGNFSFFLPAIGANGGLTATATDANNNTSEFGRTYFYSTGASGLYAAAQSSTSIQLSWKDPNLIETGFRVERSTNGTTFGTVTTVGANAAAFLDTGLSPNTLYYYRVIATTAGPDAPASNGATATTFPATAAKICFDRLPRPNAFAITGGAAWDGNAWAVAWFERDSARDNIDVAFRRFDATTLAPIGPVVHVSTLDSNASGFTPRLTWNGQHHALTWFENVSGDKDSDRPVVMMFSLLDAAGAVIRGNVRIPVPLPNLEPTAVVWDGTHWGVFGVTSPGDGVAASFGELYYLRLSEDGSAVLGPLALSSTAQLDEYPVDAAWNPQQSQYGVAFGRGKDDDREIVLQRFSDQGVAIDAQPIVLSSFSVPGAAASVGGVQVAWDGTSWAVGWHQDDPTSQVETAVYLRRVDQNGVPLGVAPTRISDPSPASDSLAEMIAKPGGGHALFVNTSGLNFPQFEIGRLQATAGGARDGSLALLTPDDNQPSTRPAVAGNGTDFLLVYSVGGNGTLPNELSGVRVAANGLTPPGSPVTLTAGHDPGVDVPRQLQALAVGDGFVGLWVDGLANALRLNLRAWNGSGQAVSTLTPLTATSTRSVIGAVAVGNTFALAWKTLTNNIVFARYNASGGTIVSEKIVANAGNNNNANVALGWDGENYAIIWNNQGGPRFLRVQSDGTAIGTPTALPRGPDGLGQLQWLGDGYGIATRQNTAQGAVEYLRVSSSGVLLDGPVAVTNQAIPVRTPTAQRLYYTGTHLGLIWTGWNGLEPPAEDVYFTVLNHDGSKQFPEVPVVATSTGDFNARLYRSGANFRVIANGYGYQGLKEIEVTPSGVVQPGLRSLANRPGSIGGPAVAYNGTTLGALYFPTGLQHLYFQTDACLADATPPPCPAVTGGFSNGAVQLQWPAVNDPESGVVRYLVFRDGFALGEVDADLLSFADSGYDPGGNVYEVRALNGAFLESQACAVSAPDVNKIFEDDFE